MASKIDQCMELPYTSFDRSNRLYHTVMPELSPMLFRRRKRISRLEKHLSSLSLGTKPSML